MLLNKLEDNDAALLILKDNENISGHFKQKQKEQTSTRTKEKLRWLLQS